MSLTKIRLPLLIITFFIGIHVNAQQASNVKVVYESYVEFNDANSRDEFEKAIKKAGKNKSYYEFNANNKFSTFEYVEKINNSQEDEGGLEISMAAPFKLYKNFHSKISLMEIDAFGENYLLKDSIKLIDWKLTRENKLILDHRVMKATAKMDSLTTAIAWYAPKIPIPNGPEYFEGLPGLILELAILKENELNGITIYRAVEISFNKASKIEQPKKGKIIWKDEFVNQQNEYLKKLREMHSNGVDVSE